MHRRDSKSNAREGHAGTNQKLREHQVVPGVSNGTGTNGQCEWNGFPLGAADHRAEATEHPGAAFMARARQPDVSTRGKLEEEPSEA